MMKTIITIGKTRIIFLENEENNKIIKIMNDECVKNMDLRNKKYNAIKSPNPCELPYPSKLLIKN